MHRHPGHLGVDNSNTWGGKFYDNGVYIGHDEPDTTFLSNAPGSGNNVNWTETLGRDPSALPTDVNPGHDVSHWFELTPAPWFSMALCDPNSYPQTAVHARVGLERADLLRPDVHNRADGGGSTFMEMQLYPPGKPPFVDSESCNATQWCAALTIDSLECTDGLRDLQRQLRGTGQLRLHPDRTECRPGRRHRRTRTSPRSRRTTRRCS